MFTGRIATAPTLFVKISHTWVTNAPLVGYADKQLNAGMPKTVKSRRYLNQVIMKRMIFLVGIFLMVFIQIKAQNLDTIATKHLSELTTSIRGGYDVLPFYNNNTPYVDYKGGITTGLSINYYWNWIGLGGDFDYIQNRPKSIYPTNNTAFIIREDKISRMFYGIGPSLRYVSNEKFTTELFLRGGLGRIKGGYTEVSMASPTQLVNFHAGYNAKSVPTAKAQLQVGYYVTPSVGIQVGAYYMRHFNVPERIDPGYAFSAAYIPVVSEQESVKPSLVTRTHPCNCDISSLGVFAGVSVKFPKRQKLPKEYHTMDNYALAITARDKYTKEVLPNTDVVVKNVNGDIINTGTTNNYGVVVFENVRPGNYSIAGKLFDVDLEGAIAVLADFKPNTIVQKEVLYTDDRFILKGQVVECNAAAPLANASVVLTNHLRAEQKTTNTDNKGAFIFHALQNAVYEVYAKKNNYFSQTETIATQNFDRNKTLFVKLEVCMEKTDCGKAITLKNIHYDLDKYFIRDDAKPELNKLAQFMKDNPGVKVELSSHTDSRASDAYNMTLSQNRANAAVNYLVSQGISKDRLIPVGYGERKLLNKCADGISCSEAEHQLNRRTEMKIICPDIL